MLYFANNHVLHKLPFLLANQVVNIPRVQVQRIVSVNS